MCVNMYTNLYIGFRSMPAMDLRKTCKLLKPFLVGDDKKVEFEKTYTIMIDAVNDIDVVRTHVYTYLMYLLPLFMSSIQTYLEI
jgi:hypothetical protein